MAHLDRAATRRRRALNLLASLLACAIMTAGARAEIHDYQIMRLLSYTTDCEPLRVEDRSDATGPRRFFAACSNASFYPDGAQVACEDRDDERSCRVLTEPLSFGNLRLLDQRAR